MTEKELYLFHKCVYWLRRVVEQGGFEGKNDYFAAKKCLSDIDGRQYFALTDKVMLEGKQKVIDKLKSDLVEATVLLKYCVNYYERPMTAAISGKLGEKIKEFIKRQEE